MTPETGNRCYMQELFYNAEPLCEEVIKSFVKYASKLPPPQIKYNKA
jgi:hypothetical protein